jgi:alpha-beta hydrolase superfamily lysophospholipase
VGGQRVDARDRLYLAAEMPTLIVSGQRDRIIPAAHSREAHDLIGGSRLETFEDSGHYPHMDDPHRFAALLAGFIASTDPADVDPERWRELLRQGAGSAARAAAPAATPVG